MISKMKLENSLIGVCDKQHLQLIVSKTNKCLLNFIFYDSAVDYFTIFNELIF